MYKQIFTFIFILSLSFLSSCETVTTGFEADQAITESGDNLGGTDGSSQSAALEQAIANAIAAPPTVEIRHFIEPVIDSSVSAGSYLKKLTIPKDYKGTLLLAGINVATLAGKNVKVRMKFGVNGEFQKVFDAHVGTAPGLLENSVVSVLALDLRDRPFINMNLIYDLYDYNDYSFDGASGPSILSEAVGYNRDQNLFCRGLSLSDDPTFTGSVASGCQASTDVCKYAYAKVVDQGLQYPVTGGVAALIPSRAQVQATSGVSYFNEADDEKLKRCLPDDPVTQQLSTGSLFVFDNTTTFGMATSQVIDGVTYTYQGPYRLTSTSTWQITPDSNATINKYGLFGTSVPTLYFQSKLFPRYVRKDLSIGLEYLGAGTPNAAKLVQTMAATGQSQWMDGCNERAVTKDESGEHIGSCSVTGTIEVYYLENGVENQVSLSTDVKLQIIKEANNPDSTTDVASSSFQACTSTSQCGSTGCCINNRCWDKTIVSSCIEDEPSYGNEVTGSSCQSDYECASLCCNQGTGTCAVHDESQTPPVLCSKQVGQSCVAKNWCEQQPVTKCFVVKTGVDSQGAQLCALRCYTNPESGECRNGVCTAPIQPTPPTFDVTDPNRCDNACDPPDFTNGVFSINCGSEDGS
jgi:hypothetical protein